VRASIVQNGSARSKVTVADDDLSRAEIGRINARVVVGKDKAPVFVVRGGTAVFGAGTGLELLVVKAV